MVGQEEMMLNELTSGLVVLVAGSLKLARPFCWMLVVCNKEDKRQYKIAVSTHLT